jgi:hypothetical protein
MYKESIGTCTLTRNVTDADKEHDCKCYNRDLSEYDICYNCKYYRGGGDWGLFCSHKDMYHHLGKFSDDPCEKYEKKPEVMASCCERWAKEKEEENENIG